MVLADPGQLARQHRQSTHDSGGQLGASLGALWRPGCRSSAGTPREYDPSPMRTLISVSRFGSRVWSVPWSVVCPCIAVMGLGPTACNRVEETTGGAAHDERRDHGVSQCRGGLAPTARLTGCLTSQAAMGAAWRCRVPWVAMLGSHAVPVVMTACRCRRIAAAITVCAWVGVSLLCSRVVRWW